MLLLLLITLLACPGPGKNGTHPMETGDSDADTDSDTDTDSDADTDLPEGWPEPWGVLSLNLHCLKTEGTSFSTNTERFEAIAREVANRDIVALAVQEACRNESETAMDMLRSALQAATGVTWSAEWELAHIGWEGTEDEAEEGVGLLARGSLSDPMRLTYHYQEGLTRVLLGATLDNGVRLFTVHLENTSETAREFQGRETATAALVSSDPDLDLLVAGDFNDDSQSSAYWAMTATGFVEDTSAQDDARDHIFRHRAANLVFHHASYLFDGTNGPTVSDHQGLGSWYEGGRGEDACMTRVEVRVSVPERSYVALRGAVAPLDWSYGLPAYETEVSSWKWLSTEIPNGSFEYKALLDDRTWQAGENAVGQGCQDNVDTPTWE